MFAIGGQCREFPIGFPELPVLLDCTVGLQTYLSRPGALPNTLDLVTVIVFTVSGTFC